MANRALNHRPRDLGAFLLTRGLDGYNPHPLFDVNYYLSQRGDLAEAAGDGLNAVLHYLERGAAEGLNPHPLFDTHFYVEQCGGIEGAVTSPLVHFLSEGWRMRLDPHPMFSTSYYLQRYREVEPGINPVLHCLARAIGDQGDLSPWFDGRYYMAAHQDVANSGSGPFDHYFRFGIAEGRPASRWAADLLATQPEFARPHGLLELAREMRRSADRDLSFGPLTPSQRQRAVKLVDGFSYQPVVSLLLHAVAGDEATLDETLRSIEQQTYTRVQICVAVDPNVADAVWAVLDRLLAVPGTNLAVVRRGWVGDPAFALNAALDMACGEFIAVVQEGGLLNRTALASLVGAMQGAGQCDLVYGDEDRIGADGLLEEPFHKTDWSETFLLGCDYVSRLGLYRAALVRSLAGFRPGLGGGCVHELTLRMSPRLNHRTVRHVPKLVYRTLAQPRAARDAMARQDDTHRAIAGFMKAERLDGQVIRRHGQFQIKLANTGEPLVSIIIPTANSSFAGPLGREWVLTNCVKGIIDKTDYTNVEIIVVHDGNLLPEQVEAFEALKVRLLRYRPKAFNFSRKVNIGVRASTGEFVLILNDDVEPKRPDWLNAMLGHAERPGIGVVGAKLFFPDGRLQHTGVVLQNGLPGHLYYRAGGFDAGKYGMNDLSRNVLAVTGACQLLPRAVFDGAGGYDESLPLNYNDVDFCLRIIDLGYQIIYAADAELYHFEGVTKEEQIGNRDTLPSETDLFQARWRARYAIDPYYHPELPAQVPLGWQPVDAIRRTPGQARVSQGAKAAPPRGVNFFGAVDRISGLGTASRGYVAALQSAELSTRIVNLDKLYAHHAVCDSGYVSVPQDFPISLVLANADATPAAFLLHGSQLEGAAYRIGLWVWELPAIRPEWVDMIEKYDEIWVPSRFCHDAFQPMTNKPVTIMPYALPEPPTFTAADRLAMRERFGIPPGSFVFLFMFDTFSFVDRKNPTCLLDGFEAEFRKRNDVTLVLKISYFANLQTGYSVGNASFRGRLKNFLERCSNVVVIPDILPERDVHALIDAADCYVSPHRSEGFGLTIAEAMHYRKAVISTDFSGTRDLVNDGTGLKLRCALTEVPSDMGPYLKGNIWAEPSVEHLRELMCEVESDAELRTRLGNAAHHFVATQLSPFAVGVAARKRLRDIADRL